jgi:putative NADH-flavin reductase
MASYAVLGSTGNCGSALIQNLLQTPNVKVHAYCRNKAKLLRLLPEVAEHKKVEIFEGSIHNVDLLASCVRGCRAVFLVVTTNDNVPGCRVSQDLAQGVIEALERLKAESKPGLKMPKLVLLSSATIDDHLARNMPRWFRPIMLTAASHVYNDLILTERFLREQQDWVSTIFIKPAGLSVDKQRGHKLDFDHEESFISYLDLAAAMLEAANDPEDRYDMRNVSVVNTNGGAKFPPGTPMCILMGLIRHFFPFLHPYLPSTGPS